MKSVTQLRTELVGRYFWAERLDALVLFDVMTRTARMLEPYAGIGHLRDRDMSIVEAAIRSSVRIMISAGRLPIDCLHDLAFELESCLKIDGLTIAEHRAALEAATCPA